MLEKDMVTGHSRGVVILIKEFLKNGNVLTGKITVCNEGERWQDRHRSFGAVEMHLVSNPPGFGTKHLDTLQIPLDTKLARLLFRTIDTLNISIEMK